MRRTLYGKRKDLCRNIQNRKGGCDLKSILERQRPVCLKDMIVDMPEKIEKVFSDYKMNLVQIRDSGQYIFHNEDVKNLFEVSRMIYEEDFQTLNNTYKDKRLNGEMVRLIGKITGIDVLDEFEEDEEVEGSKMCRALENLKESGRAEGRAEGELNKIKEQIQKKIAKGKTAEVIAEELEEEIIVIRKLIKEMNL